MNAPAWAGQLWTAVWQGGLFILVVWGMCRYWRGLSSEARYWLWWLACAKLLIGLVPLPAIELPLLRPQEAAAWPISTNLEQVDPPVVSAADRALYSPAATPAAFFDPWLILAGVWGAGVLLRSLRNVKGGLRLKGIVARGTPLNAGQLGAMARELGVELGIGKSPRIVSSEEVTSPLVTGLLHPTVVVPTYFGSDLTPEEVRLALTHELAHIRRRDLPIGIVPMLAETIFFFLPPAWLAYGEWVTEREAACDEAVLRHSGAPPATYGNLLVQLVSRDSHAIPAAVGATSGYHTLKRRLMLMKSFGNSRRTFRWGTVAIVVAAVLAAPWTVTAQGTAGGKNLLRNASLDSNTDGWVQGNAIDGVKYMRVENVSRTGKGSLAIIKTAEKYFPVAQWSQPFRHDGKSKFLKVSAWVKARVVTKSIVDVQFLKDGGGGAKEPIGHKWAIYIGAQEMGDSPAEHDWKEMTGVVEIPEGTQDIIVALQGYGPGSVWFDDITAEYTDKAGPSASEQPEWKGGPNVVLNGGFEDGFGNWEQGSLPPNTDIPAVRIVTDISTFKSGKQSMLFAKTAETFFPVKLINQSITIEKGKYSKAMIKVWVKAENASKLTIPFYHNGNGELDKVWGAYVGIQNDGDKPANHDWRQYISFVTIPPTATSIGIGAEMYGPGRVWLDDLEISLK